MKVILANNPNKNDNFGKILQSQLHTLTFTFVFYFLFRYNSFNYLTKIEGAHDTTALTQVWAKQTKRGVFKNTQEDQISSFGKKQRGERGAPVPHRGLTSLPARLHRSQQHTGSYREKARGLHRFKQ